MNLIVSTFSLGDILNDVITVFDDTAKAKGLRINVSTNGLPPLISSDPARIRQILVNLIGNAVKFTTTGSVSIFASLKKIDTRNATLTIQVKDTGVGISQEQVVKLFQPFVQADEGTSRNFGGTGLGLALSRRLAHALNGDIHILESAVNKGSTFAFDIMVQTPESNVAPTAQPALTTDKPSIQDARILVVDDAPDNRALMKLLLKRQGAITEEAENGELAVEKALSGNFDIVLMDIQMPGMDGYQALAALKKQGYYKPVVALTAHAMLEERDRTRQAGFTDHITKPVDRESLLISLDRILKAHK